MNTLFKIALLLYVSPYYALAQDSPSWTHILPLEVSKIAFDSSHTGQLWIVGDGGVKSYTFSDDSWFGYTTADGLSNMHSWSLRVEPNYVWIGNVNGNLDQLDKSANRVIKTIRLPSNNPDYGTIINTIDVDQHHLWVGTHHGLFQIDKSTLEVVDHFTQNEGLDENSIVSVIKKDNALWVLTQFNGIWIGLNPIRRYGGLSRIDINTKAIETIPFTTRPKEMIDTGENLWILFDQVLQTFNIQSKTFTSIEENTIKRPSSLISDKQSIWCVAHSSTGQPTLFNIDKQTQTILKSHLLPEEGLGDAQISQNDTHIFIATRNILYKFSKSLEVFAPLRHPFLPKRFCLSILPEKDFTFLARENILTRLDNHSLAYDEVQIHSERLEVIREIKQFGDSLWVSTQSGLFAYTPADLTRVASFFGKTLVFCIQKEGDFIWASTQYGLQRLNRKTNQIEKLELENQLNAFGEPTIQSLVLDKDVFWVTFSGDMRGREAQTGIAKVNKQTLKPLSIIQIPMSNTTEAMETLIDAGSFLFASGKVISKISKRDLTFETFANIKTSNMILKKSRLWAQVESGGVKVFDIHSGSELIHINEKTGLMFDGIWSMGIGEKYGWFATSRGISRLTLSSIFPTSQALESDFNHDGQVDFTDLLLFAQRFGTTQTDGIYDDRYDLDRNGFINFKDFLLFIQSFP